MKDGPREKQATSHDILLLLGCRWSGDVTGRGRRGERFQIKKIVLLERVSSAARADGLEERLSGTSPVDARRHPEVTIAYASAESLFEEGEPVDAVPDHPTGIVRIAGVEGGQHGKG